VKALLLQLPMNANNIEVELKFRVKDKPRLLSWLRANAKLESQNRQIDDYYTPAHRNFFAKEFPDEFLRIRRSGEKASITYKFWNTTGDNKQYSHCDEYETDVENGDQIEKIFKALDLKLVVTVDKNRSSYRYKNFEIEVDDIAEIGTVCEIEIKGGYESVTEAHKQICDLAELLGFSESDRGGDMKLGYALMIMKKKGLLVQQL
jgi:predicted adenylyl cyclase CyaB